jgi:hypothetical protein
VNAFVAPNAFTACWRTQLVKYGCVECSAGGVMSACVGRLSPVSCEYSRWVMYRCSSIARSTRLRRATAA